METMELEMPVAKKADKYKWPEFKARYENFIGGKFMPPVRGEYFDNISPINGKVFTQAARSGKEDIELALDAAH